MTTSRGDAAGAIAVLGTFDTKADELHYLARAITGRGDEVVRVDLSVSGAGDSSAEYPTTRLLGADGRTFADADKDDRMEIVQGAARRLLADLYARGEIAGAVAIGGGRGTWLGIGILEALPLAAPKIMVSTVAHDASRYLGISNVIVVPSLTDMVGLNDVLRQVLDDAATMITQLAQAAQQRATSDRPAVALSTFGVTTKGAKVVSDRLGQQGRDVIAFHANGRGGRVLELFVAEGLVGGVVDWTMTEMIDELVGGIGSAGPGRFDAVGAPAPRIVVPGAVDVVNFGAPLTVPAEFEGRVFHQHTPLVTLMRSTAAENAQLGGMMAAKLRGLSRRTALEVIIPARGFSALDIDGGPFFDPEADRAFCEALQAGLPTDVPYSEEPVHINDARFAQLVSERFLALVAGS